MKEKYHSDTEAEPGSGALSFPDPMDPVDPVNKMDPTGPANAGCPVDPTALTDTMRPVDATVPSDTTCPVDPTAPTDTMRPVDATVPSDTTCPVDPTAPTNPPDAKDPADPTDALPVRWGRRVPAAWEAAADIGTSRPRKSRDGSVRTGRQRSGKERSGKECSGKECSGRDFSGEEFSANEFSEEEFSGKDFPAKELSEKVLSAKEFSGKEFSQKQSYEKEPLRERVREREQKSLPRAILAGCNTGMPVDRYARAIAELRGLAQACGLAAVSTVLQNAAEITHATFLGSGKVAELRQEVERCDADIVLFNEALTPMQMRNLEKELDTEVLDRTGLILQIFAARARTREAKLQVESAQLQYMLPRLVGMRAALSRQGGGSGRLSNKGAGEQKLELDRRRIEHRIAELRRELEVVSRERATQRGRRLRTGLTRVALVGYTNAGKSTVMNALLRYCDKERQVFEADMLFATLDTSVRRIDAPGHIPFLLSDTVGFVSDLPHTLVKAFRSTLDEVCCADLLLEVVDFSDPDYREQIEVTAKTLQEIGAGNIPLVYLYNKTDLAMENRGAVPDGSAAVDAAGKAPTTASGSRSGSTKAAESPPDNPSSFTKARPVPDRIPFRRGDVLYLAAGKEIGLPEILSLIDDAMDRDRITQNYLIPYTEGAMLQQLRSRGALLSEEYLPEGVLVRARCRREDALRFKRYAVKH